MRNLGKVVFSKFDERGGWEAAQRTHGQTSVLQIVQIAHHQQQIRRLFDGQETATRHIQTCIDPKTFPAIIFKSINIHFNFKCHFNLNQIKFYKLEQ